MKKRIATAANTATTILTMSLPTVHLRSGYCETSSLHTAVYWADVGVEVWGVVHHMKSSRLHYFIFDGIGHRAFGQALLN